MDLIYADENMVDIGVLSGYTFDLAYGSDENNFECTLNLTEHCCEAGYYLYIEGTEYGGIIDKVSVKTEAKEVIYSGRTWHGILEKKIIEPDEGEDYLALNGEANEILGWLINQLNLSNLFVSSVDDSGIEIVEYQIRYTDAYAAIKKMLSQFDGKLKVNFQNKKVVLSAIPLTDYSQDEEWDSSQVSFGVEKNYRPVNHLICLGSGDLKDRHVIHLFTDENGGIQPYAKSDSPMQDSDYILDKSQQILFGEWEITEKYDYPNVQSAENYVRLPTKPSDWVDNFTQYYENEDGKFKQLTQEETDYYELQKMVPYDWSVSYKNYYKRSGDNYTAVSDISEEVYSAQTIKPSDWSKNYSNYYKKSGNKFVSITGAESSKYNKQSKKPSDWGKNYKNYFYYYSDGTSFEYKTVESITKYRYLPQTLKPSDWDANYRNYFCKKKTGGYTALEKKKAWKAKRFYTKQSYQVPPVWKSNMYYTEEKSINVPQWVTGTYYTKELKTMPTWEANTYYTKSKAVYAPFWVPGRYYKKVFDNYAELVSGGLEKLKESYNCDSIQIDLNPNHDYDIGDIVGAIENVTGITVWQPITKKIVTIKDSQTNISYEIGV